MTVCMCTFLYTMYIHMCIAIVLLVLQIQDVLKANGYIAVRVLKDSIECQQFSQLCILGVVRVVRV